MIREMMLAGVAAAAPVADGPAAPAPTLTYAFSVEVTLAPPVEQGVVDGQRMRFVPITGGRIHGPRLSGSVLPGGGDWQAIARGEAVAADSYYFRTSPRFTVGAGRHEWLRRTMFVARGVRLPDRVTIDFYAVG